MSICSRGVVRVKPFAVFWIAVGTNLGGCTCWLVVEEIPPLPPASFVRRLLRWSVFFFSDQIPFPGPFLFGKSFPWLIPQFMWSETGNGLPAYSRYTNSLTFM